MAGAGNAFLGGLGAATGGLVTGIAGLFGPDPVAEANKRAGEQLQLQREIFEAQKVQAEKQQKLDFFNNLTAAESRNNLLKTIVPIVATVIVIFVIYKILTSK
jgi:hypothetical protein